MQLLELHIRNIASITSADIDFEQGLTDPDTGLPAQKFLISGDTGTGKSILLDAITMTLFNVTPRMREVADKRMNKFTNASGNEVNICSLEQYTRLGISPRDECYASTRFRGNDGRTYTATRRLGLTRTGNYRNEWLLQCDGQPDLNGTRCGEAIREAIGMTYEQFSRMAMLAQGQFTSFLCGSRADRADILEKLTNTSRFSLYGQAIQTLARRKADLMREAEIALHERQATLLGPDEREATEARRDLAAQKRDCLTDTAAALQNQISLLQQLAQQTTLRDTAQKEAAAKEAVLAEAQAWLDAQAGKAPLFENAAETAAQVEAYGKETVRLGKSREEQARREAAKPQLEQAVQTATEAVEQAVATVAAKQREADSLAQQAQALDGEQLRRQRETLTAEGRSLEAARNALAELGRQEAALRDKRSEQERTTPLLQKASAEADTLLRKTAEAEQAYKKALGRYTTLHASIEETLTSLRMQMAQNGVDTCPLCRQHVPHPDHLAEAFDADRLLLPLEQERNATEAAYRTAKQASDAAQREAARLAGIVESLRADVARRSQEAAAQRQRTHEDMCRAQRPDWAATPPQPLADTINTCLNTLISQDQALAAKQQQLADLLKQRDARLNERAPLDQAAQQARDALARATNARDNNITDIGRLQRETAELAESLAQQASTLDTRLLPFYPWRDTPAEAVQRLRADAKAYLDRRHQRDIDLADRQGALRRRDEANTLILSLSSALGLAPDTPTPDSQAAIGALADCNRRRDEAISAYSEADARLRADEANNALLGDALLRHRKARDIAAHWATLNSHFGGDRFRNLVQTHILRPLLANANLYLRQITDRYTLACTEENEMLSILVRDNYNRGELRSATVLSGGERFMISLALSLALSSLGRDDLNVNILFIDEGFGTLDQQSLDSVMRTLSGLGRIAGGRRVGIISHREELAALIPNKILVEKSGEGRSTVRVVYEP